MNAAVKEVATSTELAVVQNAIVNIDKVGEGIAELTKLYKGVVFAVDTKEGMKAAIAARAACREPRLAVERIRESAKKPILELGRKLDGEAKRIKDSLAALEDPIDAQIKAHEQKLEDERQAKIQREQQRVADIQGRIADMRTAVNGALRAKTSADIVRILADVQGVVIDPELFAEFKDTATLAKSESVAEIERIRDEFIAREQEAERLRKERAELDKQRAEQAERERTERERRDAEAARVRVITERIVELRGCQTLTASSGSELIAEHLRELDKLSTDATIFAEYTQQAVDAKTAGTLRLAALFKAAKDHEAEQSRMAAERKRLDNEAAALAERQRQEREATEAKARQEQQAEEDRKLAAARALIEAELEQRRKDEAEAAERRKNFKPTLDNLVAVIASRFERDEETARMWIISAVHNDVGHERSGYGLEA
jgi:hypothetical protein